MISHNILKVTACIEHPAHFIMMYYAKYDDLIFMYAFQIFCSLFFNLVLHLYDLDLFFPSFGFEHPDSLPILHDKSCSMIVWKVMQFHTYKLLLCLL